MGEKHVRQQQGPKSRRKGRNRGIDESNKSSGSRLEPRDSRSH